MESLKKIPSQHIVSIISNKGTGAGGCNTNKNGLPYEELTHLQTDYSIISKNIYSDNIHFNNYSDTIFIRVEKGNLFKYMGNKVNKNIIKAHGCKNPDECYINEATKKIFLLEKKFQQVSGSVCEKIQTAGFKRRHYNKTFPDYDVIYMYCLSDWFKLNCKPELDDLKEINIPVFWGNDVNYKCAIIDYIINYK
jgi:hypothetical protein